MKPQTLFKSIWTGTFGSRSVKLSNRDDAETLRAALMQSTSAAGKAVNVETALSLSTAWSCTRLLSETIGTLPMGFYERQGEDRVPATGHALYSMLHDSPNADQTAAEFWEAQVACLCLWGNGYSEKEKIGDRLVGLTMMRPDRVRVFRQDGRRKYRYADPYTGSERILDEDAVFHIRGFGTGGDVGLSPISYARQTMGIALAADETAGATFANGLQLSGFLEPPAGAKWSPEQKTELMDLFAKFAGSAKSGKVMPLPEGSKFAALGIKPEDSQLLESRAFNVEEICRWFRVPPFMVGHTEKSTSWGTGLEQQMIGFLTFSLRPYLTRIEQAIKKQLLTPAERLRYFAEFNLEGLLRADSAGRAALYSSAGQNGWMDRNEIRRKENLSARKGAGELTVQSSLVPLAMLGQDSGGAAPADQQARSALANWLFGGDIEALVAAHVSKMIGHNGGPPMQESE